TYLRAGYPCFNFYNSIPVLKQAGILGSNFPASTSMELVQPYDIAAAAAEELQKSGEGKNVRYIVSDIRTAGEVARVLGAAFGNKNLPWIEFTDEQAEQGIIQEGLPEEIGKLYAEM